MPYLSSLTALTSVRHLRAAAAKVYTEAGIPTTVVADAAVGTIMDQIDLCLMGAEGVMENGGVINKVRGSVDEWGICV